MIIKTLPNLIKQFYSISNSNINKYNVSFLLNSYVGIDWMEYTKVEIQKPYVFHLKNIEKENIDINLVNIYEKQKYTLEKNTEYHIKVLDGCFVIKPCGGIVYKDLYTYLNNCNQCDKNLMLENNFTTDQTSLLIISKKL